jgi:CheY-like chemotaxis protein
MARILVVDDYAALLFMVRMILELEGHEVETVETGIACLKKAKEWRPHLVLLDTDMPGMKGLSVCAHIKKDPSLEKMPVLMMTGRPAVDIFAQAEHAGARVMLLKPFTRDQLLAEIAQALGESSGVGVSGL